MDVGPCVVVLLWGGVSSTSLSGPGPFLLGFSVFSYGELFPEGSSHTVRGSRASSSLLAGPLWVHGGDLSLGCPFGSTRSAWSLWVSMLFNLQVMLRQCLGGWLLLASSGVVALGTRHFFSVANCFLQLRLSPLSLPQSSTYMELFSGAMLWWLSHLLRSFHSFGGACWFLSTLCLLVLRRRLRSTSL